MADRVFIDPRTEHGWVIRKHSITPNSIVIVARNSSGPYYTYNWASETATSLRAGELFGSSGVVVSLQVFIEQVVKDMGKYNDK